MRPSRPVSPWRDLERGIGRVLAEFSFWPLGWVLTFDDATVQGAPDTIPAWTVPHSATVMRGAEGPV